MIEIEHRSNKAKRGETSLFGKCMAKTRKIINSLMVVDAKAQQASLLRCLPLNSAVYAVSDQCHVNDIDQTDFVLSF